MIISNKFGHFCILVERLKPGERCNISIRELNDSKLSYEHNGAIFEVEDQILENIVGSRWTHSYIRDSYNMCVIFIRHDDRGIAHYVSPDLRNKG